jgi:hypothetical protein
LRPLFLAFGLLTIAACGGDSMGPTAPATTTTTTAPLPKAQVTMTIDRFEADPSPERDKLVRFTWDIRLTETAGVGARVNFIRQEIWNRDFDQYERSEIGYDEVPEVCGTNELVGNSEWQCRVPFDFNLNNFEGYLRLIVSLFDDNGHSIPLIFERSLSD